MKTTLNTFEPKHYDEVLALWKECDGIGLSEADSKENIHKFLNSNQDLSLIAELDSEIVGAILVGNDGRRGYIHHLAVSPKFRKRGIGKGLVEAGIEKLKDIGITKCHLFIFTNNKSGKQFWEKCGWSYREELRVISKNIK
ncbi:GNAT family N-acetyltransferase [Desulfopila sp. IMCC35008]|uniref:GNAT family N-acetyltransferase n=1 Tax=Desulfopila sp. IMCC35008 TaxID=2653858 RepID=UPI0013D2C37B|nr:GNAT family N-acetyltransferase [Desulfopila sp. IMCC35008]